MTRKLLTIDEFRASAKGGTRPEGTVLRLATSDPVLVDDTRTLRFVFSDDSVDRAGDRIMVDGWETDDFNRNPVALWAHSSWDPPIGKAANVGVSNGKLVGDIEFAAAEIYAFADTVFRLVKGKFLRAVSVGFLPTEYKFVESKDRPWGIDFIKQSLLEISLCPIPCNPNALQEAKAQGIDTAPLREWASKVLDEGGSVLIPRTLLEETFKAAKTPKTVRRQYLKPAEETADPKAAGTDNTPTGDGDGGDATKPPVGNCGRPADQTCGMKDPQDCAIHATPAESKALKAGRRISAANKALLEQAVEHHASATKCIKDVLESNDPTEPDPNDPADPADDLVVDPEKQRADRLRKAKALKASLALA